MALFKRSERLLGIDIGSSSVKIMELSRSGQRYRVEAAAMESFPAGAIEERNPADMEAVTGAIKRVLKSSGSRLRKAATAVPSSSVIIRTIPLSLDLGEDDIEATIQLDASEYIPFPLEEIYLDFQVVPGSAKPAAGTRDVIIVASRRENVDSRRDVIQNAGLKAAVVDVEAYALENTYGLLAQGLFKGNDSGAERGQGNALNALVDIGATSTTVYIFHGDKVVFTREQTFGGEQLTRSIMEAYELPRDKAEAGKRSGELPEGYVTTILGPFQQVAAEQIGQALQFFFSSDYYHASRQTLDYIALVGGGALTFGLDTVISSRLNIPTVLGNPFGAMSSAAQINRYNLLREAPLFAVACGLALRGFD